MTALKELSASFFIFPFEPRLPPSFNLPQQSVIFHSLKVVSTAAQSRLAHFRLFPRLYLLQYDYMERLDGKEKWSVVESPRERRSIQTVVLNEAVFVQYLDAGAWHLAFYNDGREREIVSFSTNIMGKAKKKKRRLWCWKRWTRERKNWERGEIRRAFRRVGGGANSLLPLCRWFTRLLSCFIPYAPTKGWERSAAFDSLKNVHIYQSVEQKQR